MLRCLLFLLTLMNGVLLFSEPQGLQRLIEGNKRYLKDLLEHSNRTLERRQSIVSKQEPFAVIVGCSDSRVSPEIIFDQGVGDLFVVRVAGNVIGPLEQDSIDYAAIYLHAATILILGHENCGAVQAVIEGTTKDIESVAKLITPAVNEERKKHPPNLLTACVKRNVLNMKKKLLATPAIARLVKEKKIEVHAGYYHLESGSVEFL